MQLEDRTVLVLGGAGLVGTAVVRRILTQRPRRVVVTSLRREEAEQAVADLREERARLADEDAPQASLEARWGDLFVPHELRERSRPDVVGDPEARRRMIDDIYGELTAGVLERSALGTLLLDVRPQVIVDCINTAGALAYQNVFASVAALRERAARGDADEEAVERHLATLYLPQLIRHVQLALEAMRRVDTEIYVKIGTAGTGGMGLNIPFTHSEERPSRVLLAKSGLAGAQTLLLYLMARTPGAPAVKEIKPTAAISWKSIGHGPIRHGGRIVELADAERPLPVEEAFEDDAGGWRTLGRPLEGVYLDAGENGVFAACEFETLTALGLMEFVTPEEIAENVLREIQAHPTGKDVVAALDGATMGPTYRAGVLRNVALQRMATMEEERGERGVAYEMLGPPRLTKLLFEAEVLGRLYDSVDEAAGLDPEATAERARGLLEEEDELRRRILSIGIPILLPDGLRVLRGPRVHVPWLRDDVVLAERAAHGDPGAAPAGAAARRGGAARVEPRGETSHPAFAGSGIRPDGSGADVAEDGPGYGRLPDRGWVDLRPSNWACWRERLQAFSRDVAARPGPEQGSRADHELADPSALLGTIRPGQLGAWIFRTEDRGQRIKR